MRSKTVRVEQREANLKEVDKQINEEIEKLEKAGHTIKDIRIAVGRDADNNSGIDIKFSMTTIILYE